MPARRKRRTKAEIEALEGQIYECLALDHPQSVRHVFYRMTDPRLPAPVAKDELGYRTIQRICADMRKGGRLPYGWIADTTRRGYHVQTFADGADYIRSMAGAYRQRLWTYDLPRVEVWTESRSLAGVLEADCRELAVSLYPAGGFSSLTLCYEAAEEILNTGLEWAVILFAGDYDPAGVLIDQDIEAKLRAHLAGSVDVDFHRLAITEAQIEEYDLPTKPRKAGDRRSLHVRETVEAEALPAAILRAIVREAVESYLPEGALDVTRAAEQSEREGLYALAQDLRG